MGKNHGDLKKGAQSEWEKRWRRENKMDFLIFFLLRSIKSGDKIMIKWKDENLQNGLGIHSIILLTI